MIVLVLVGGGVVVVVVVGRGVVVVVVGGCAVVVVVVGAFVVLVVMLLVVGAGVVLVLVGGVVLVVVVVVCAVAVFEVVVVGAFVIEVVVELVEVGAAAAGRHACAGASWRNTCWAGCSRAGRACRLVTSFGYFASWHENGCALFRLKLASVKAARGWPRPLSC